jgi:hypothetical protein
MYRNPLHTHLRHKLGVPIAAGIVLFGAASFATAQERRTERIDVDAYAIDLEVSPNTQSLNARVTMRFVPLDDNENTATFELNNALNVSRVVDDKGKQISSSRNTQDFTIRFLAAEGATRDSNFLLRRAADRAGRFAGVRDQVRGNSSGFRIFHVSGALAAGERIHHGPVCGQHARDGADGLYGVGARSRNAHAGGGQDRLRV